MTDAAPRHPDVQIMTAFVDGKLAPHEIAEVATHLRGCAECRTVVTETARLEREEQRATKGATTKDRTPWWLAAAAIVAIVIAAVPFARWRERQASPIARLIKAAPPQHRLLEPRLAGFPWARLQAPARGGGAQPDPADMKLIGAAGEVLEQTSAAQTPEANHARGVAHLLSGRGADGIAVLEQAARAATDARVWSDLAAARLAVSGERPSQLPAALADTDRALRLNPKLPEANFNRALALERMGIRDQARKQWQRYLEIDPSGPWSVEAQAHLRALEDRSQRFDRKLLEEMPAAVLVQRFPQEARSWGEGPLLAGWADVEAAGDGELGEATLTKARAIGALLAATKGEHLLSDAVGAIDGANGGTRAALRDAHSLFRDARLDYMKRNAGVAEPKFLRAAELFRRGGSPMAEVARYYAASGAFDQNRGAEARDSLLLLLSTIDRKRYRALGAQIQWALAVAANAAGDYGSGERLADVAATTFHALGETHNAAFVDAIAAHSFDMIGARDQAWARRVRAFAVLSADHDRLSSMLHSAAMTLAAVGNNQAAAALIDIQIDEMRSDPAQLAAALETRAELASRDGDIANGTDTVAKARAAAGRVTDAALRQTLGAQIDLADAALRRVREPRAAIASLDRSIVLFSAGRLNYLLPEAYLQRARAFSAAGDGIAAAADYAAGLREVETQQQNVKDAELRLRFLDIAAQLVDGSVEFHLARGNAVEAFRIADRARALVPAAPTAAAPSPPRVERGVALIEYAVLPHSIAIFCLTHAGISVKSVVIDRAVLAERLASFAETIRRRGAAADVEAQGAALYQLLIAPLQPHLGGVDEIVIVADRELHGVPFAALYDAARRRYLVEGFTIHLAPAAASMTRDGETALQPALVVADPPTPRWPRLPATRQEAATIASAYGATLLTGEEATRARFVDAAKGSALIHFAGHADSDAGESYAALLFAASGDDSGILGASEIGKLALGKQPLVVLAACGTFRGSPRHVAGMPSLARAFLLAGARGVIGTLWEIDDDVSAPLFLRVHEHLRAGASPARAVRSAQLEMIHASDARLAHPATWAPVEMLSNSW